MTERRLALWFIILFFVQGAMLPFWWPGMHVPDLWLVTTVLLTYFYGPRVGLVAALAGGISQDIIIGNFFGLHLAAYVAGVLCTLPAWNHLQLRWNLAFLTVFIASVAGGFANVAVLLTANEIVQISAYATETILPGAAVDTAFSLPLYYILRPRRESEV